MERDREGRICLDAAEADVVRAALFVASTFPDPIAGHCDGCFHTITGVDRSELKPVLESLDELNGHNERVAEWLAEALTRRSDLTDAQLSAMSPRVLQSFFDMVAQAVDRGIPVPVGFEARLRALGASENDEYRPNGRR